MLRGRKLRIDVAGQNQGNEPSNKEMAFSDYCEVKIC